MTVRGPTRGQQGMDRVIEKAKELEVDFGVVGPFFHPSSPWCFSIWMIPLFLFRAIFLIPLLTFMTAGALFFFFFIPLFPNSQFLLSLFNNACRITCRSILFFFGFTSITTSGPVPPPLYLPTPPSSPSSPIVLVANHQSLLDVLVLLSALGPVSFVAKKTLKGIPVLGWMADRVVKCIWVERDKKDGEGTAEEIVARVEELSNPQTMPKTTKASCWPKLPLVVFPEGTTTNGLFLTRFCSGAFLPGVAVQPVAIQYHWTRASPSWESIPSLSYLSSLLSRSNTHTHLHFLPPHLPLPEEKNHPSLFAENVRKEVGEVLQVPHCESSYEEKLIFHSLIRKNMFSWDYFGGIYHGEAGGDKPGRERERPV